MFLVIWGSKEHTAILSWAWTVDSGVCIFSIKYALDFERFSAKIDDTIRNVSI